MFIIFKKEMEKRIEIRFLSAVGVREEANYHTYINYFHSSVLPTWWEFLGNELRGTNGQTSPQDFIMRIAHLWASTWINIARAEGV